MRDDLFKLAVERVLRVDFDKLPLNGTDELADCAARMWWRVHPADPEKFYEISLMYALHQIDRARGDQESTYKELTTWLAARGLNTVLDWGCGCGQVGWYFDERGFEVHFADLDTPAFQICQDYGFLTEYPSNRMHVLPSQDLRGYRFGAILAMDVLEHVRNPLKMMDDLHRMLSPKGVIAAIPTFGSSSHGEVRMRPEHLEQNDQFWGTWDETLQGFGWKIPVSWGGLRVYEPPD